MYWKYSIDNNLEWISDDSEYPDNKSDLFKLQHLTLYCQLKPKYVASVSALGIASVADAGGNCWRFEVHYRQFYN